MAVQADSSNTTCHQRSLPAKNLSKFYFLKGIFQAMREETWLKVLFNIPPFYARWTRYIYDMFNIP